MATKANITVDGTSVPAPSSMTWGKIMVSDEDAGRAQKDALMYVNKITDKVTLQLAWNNVTQSDASTILNAFDKEYINVSYYDPKSGRTTKEFYPGDMSAPVYSYALDETVYTNISFQIIER